MESKLPKHDDLEADKGVSKTADKDQSGGETSRRKPPPSDYSAEVLKGLKSKLWELNRNLLYGRSESKERKGRSEGLKERKGSEADEGRSEGSKKRKGSDDISRIWLNNSYEELKRERVEIIRKIKMIIPGFKDDFRRPDLYRVYVPVTEGIVKEQDVPPETDVYLIVEAKTKKSLQEACFGAKKMVGLIIRQKKRRKMMDEGIPYVPDQLSLRGFALAPGSPLPPVASPERSNPPSGGQLPNPPPVPPPAPPGPYAQPVATQQYANLYPQHYAYLSQYYAHLYQHYASGGKLPPVASPPPWPPSPGSYHPPPPPMPELEAKLMQDAIEASLSQLSLDSRPHQQGFAKHTKSTSF